MFSMEIITCLLAGNSSFASSVTIQDAQDRLLAVHLHEVFDAKISLLPFKGLRTMPAIAEVSNVKSGEAVKLTIPAAYVPGAFVLRIDYRAKESDTPYPAERVIFINKQDVELKVNPPYINNDERTSFNVGEEENRVYSSFMKANSARRMPIDLLRQLLLSYDRPQSDFYTQGVKEYEQRRVEYNNWLTDQARAHKKLYVSHLFGFQYIPAVVWSGDEKDHMNQILKNYFDGIDFNDPLIIRSSEMSVFMDAYMGLYGLQASTTELRDSLFTQAGSVACEKASKGDPLVYGWMVDYFYAGYETYNIKNGMVMLQKHIDDPNCLTSKKQQITERLESITRLASGVMSPDFVMSDNKGKDFEFHKWKPKARQKLLVFWTTDCIDCMKLVEELRQWHDQSANKKIVDIVAVNLDEPEVGVKRWEKVIGMTPLWKHLQAKQGVNSPVAREYSILSAPAMFLVDSKNNLIISVPENIEQLIGALKTR